MNRIIEDALGSLKGRIEKIAGQVEREGLTPRSFADLELSLHDALGEVGRAVETAVLEDADLEASAVEHGGMRHYRKYKGPQQYECLFGKITVERSVYQANGERTLCPLELNAGILHHHLTPAAAEFVSYSSAHMTAGELVDFCRRWQFLEPSETVIKHVAAEVGEMSELLADVYQQEIAANEIVAPEETAVLTVSRDGVAVNIREEGWRRAEVGTVSFYGPEVKNEAGQEERERLRTLYVGQMPETKTPAFERKFDREIECALESSPATVKIACIADGAQSNWTYFESHPLLKDAVHINDFWHTAEKLSAVSGALFGEGTDEAKRWFQKYRRILKNDVGGIDRVIRSIRYYRGVRKPRGRARKETVRTVLRYLTRNRERMKYSEYREAGLPIGSGVVESACKTLVGQRLKRAGMRWSIDGGQKILNLRAAVLSDRWDLFWRCHQDVLGGDAVAA